jgi:uncharacterized protein
MIHPNAAVLQKIYTDFSKQDFQAMLSHCDEKVTFQISGKSSLCGKFDKSSFVPGFATKLMELSGGTFQLEVHDILASDRHAVALATESLMRDGKKVEYRMAHVWRIENGKPVAWYSYPRDLYQFDAIWS